ncbi:zinc ABC transporter permease AztB [Solicola sp. PLA-1-18]|uniref:zinc ABC transporter permease AztB n=1 Tax=Solicola sp. PLA-1-18 TaxID=3380532 RepID=UPI003B7EF5DD
MEWLLSPFEVSFVQRALYAGVLVSVMCAVVGTWVVLRGLAFLGDAMSHGMLPGIAVASLLGGPLVLGAAVAAVVMAAGLRMLTARGSLTHDTGVGLLFVGMLSVGVVIVSRSQSFAVDLTGYLFGDVLGVTTGDLTVLTASTTVAVLVATALHRPFVALAFDVRVAHGLGMRPALAGTVMLLLMALAMVASFRVVGTLLVFGMLLGPPAAAAVWTRRIGSTMALAALLGAAATVVGLLVSWHARTAAGATIACLAVGTYFASAVVAALVRRHGPLAPRVAIDAPTPVRTEIS